MKLESAFHHIRRLVLVAFTGLCACVASADPIAQDVPASVVTGGAGTDCPGPYTAVATFTNSSGGIWITPSAGGTTTYEASLFAPVGTDSYTNSAGEIWFTPSADNTNDVLFASLGVDSYTNSAGEVWFNRSADNTNAVIYAPVWAETSTNSAGEVWLTPSPDTTNAVLFAPLGADDDAVSMATSLIAPATASAAASTGASVLKPIGVYGVKNPVSFPIPAPVAATNATLTDISGYGGGYESVCAVMAKSSGTTWCGNGANGSVTFPVTAGETYQLKIYVVAGMPSISPLMISFQINWN